MISFKNYINESGAGDKVEKIQQNSNIDNTKNVALFKKKYFTKLTDSFIMTLQKEFKNFVQLKDLSDEASYCFSIIDYMLDILGIKDKSYRRKIFVAINKTIPKNNEVQNQEQNNNVE